MLFNQNVCRLRETDPVVRFSENKLMAVNYSPRFVTLTREVRQLSAMGYRIPSNILEVNEHAKQFLKYAKILEQVTLLIVQFSRNNSFLLR